MFSRAHAHATGPADQRRALPPGGHRAARARRHAAEAAFATHEPQSARRLRDHRDRVSDRSQSTSDAARFSAPTGNTYGSIATVDYLLESSRRAAVLLDRSWTRRAGPAALVHAGVRLLATSGRVRAVQQHHAAETQSGRARACAGDRQQGARSGDGDSAHGPQHSVRRHRRHRGRSAAAGVQMFTDASALLALWPPRWRRPSSMWSRGEPGEGWITLTELADTLVRDHGCRSARGTPLPRD